MGPESNPKRSLRPWAVDVLVIGYLGVTALLTLRLPDPGKLPLIHLALTAGILLIRRWGPKALHQLYAALLTPILYLELDVLSGLAGGKTYDPTVMGWEKQLFGDPMPAEWFSEALPWFGFSELLHLCYLSFYPMLLFLALRLYWRRHPELQTYLWCSTAATFTIYFIQMWFPVYGPRPLMPPPDESLRGPCWWLCHYLCGQERREQRPFLPDTSPSPARPPWARGTGTTKPIVFFCLSVAEWPWPPSTAAFTTPWMSWPEPS